MAGFIISGIILYVSGSNNLKTKTTTQDNLLIKVIQPNIKQVDKWNPDKASENLDKILSLSIAKNNEKQSTVLLVWPETALTSFILQNDAARLAIKNVLKSYDQDIYLLSGVLRTDDTGKKRKYYNSMVLYDEHLSPIQIYDKSHLVPFGEYIPFQQWIPLDPVVRFNGFQSGEGPETMSLYISQADEIITLLPQICYEIIFPNSIPDHLSTPDVIVNVTNDAWYGDSAGPRQHFTKAQFRAIEEGVTVIRSANTGISGAIDPLGRIIFKQGLMSEGAHTINVPKRLLTEQVFFKNQAKNFVTLIILLMILIIIKDKLHRRVIK